MLRLCIFGAQAPSDDWLAEVVGAASGARLALFDAAASARTATEATREQIGAGDDAHRVLRAAMAAFPGEDLILLRAGTALPPYWYERLTRALPTGNVLVVSPLDNLGPARAPLPEGARSSAAPSVIDALCYAYARHRPLDWATFSPLLSAWCGAVLREVDLATVQNYTLSQTLGTRRGVLLDDLYVADPVRSLLGPIAVPAGGDTVPPSPLGELREGVAARLNAQNAAAPIAAYYGLDGKPVVLHILHAWGGGAARFVQDLARADNSRHHLVLSARGNFHRHQFGEVLDLFDGAFTQSPLRSLTLPNPIRSTALDDPAYKSFLDEILREFHVDAVMVSSLIGHSLDALRSGLPTIHFVHDFYPLWPLLHRNLDDPALKFDAAQLAQDLASIDAGYEFAERDPAYWNTLREAFADAALKAQAQLIAPSRAALDILLRLQPRLAALPSRVIPHGIEAWVTNTTLPLPSPPRRARLRLIVLGRVRRGKASILLRELLPGLSEHAELFLLGAGPESNEFFGISDVHILLNYRRDGLPALLERVAPDAALILPNFAETFSYTLSELSSLGIPVIATKLGAFVERIEDGVNGWLVAPSAPSVTQRVAQLASDRASLEHVRANLQKIPPRSLTDMAADYAPFLPATPQSRRDGALQSTSVDRLLAQTRAAQLGDAQRLVEKVRTETRAHLDELHRRSEWAISLEHDLQRARSVLVEQAAEAQQTYARLHAELERRQTELDRQQSEYDRLDGEFAERTRWALALDAQRETLQGELTTLRNSRSWRLTRPIRYAARKLRALRVRIGFVLNRLRNAGTRTRGSLARRGIAGTMQRAADELQRARGSAPNPTAVYAPPQPAAKTPAARYSVPSAVEPRVSIVIPVYNKFEYTDACLRSLAEHAGDIGFETIVVDDGSNDVTAERLGLISGIRVLRNAQNLGFIGSCNAGAQVAKGDFVLFLNNDTVVTAGWLEALLRCFAEEPDAGLVGARLVYPDGRLQEAGGIVFSDGSGWNYGRFDEPADPRYEFRREADYCSGAAIMLPRALFNDLGGFDTRYAPAYYEDTDLAFAVRAAGRKAFYEPRSVVVHFEGVTAGTDTSSGMKQYQVVNRGKFLQKWKNELARQPAPIHDAKFAAAAANHRASGHVLIVDSYTPTPDQDSGSLRMVNIMRLLRERGYRVSFLPDNQAHAGKYTEALQALGVEALYHPFVSDPAAWLRNNGSALDAVILSRHYVASSYVNLVRLYASRSRLIFDTVDLHYLREERSAALEDRRELSRQAAATKKQELKLIAECDLTLVVSPVEKALLEREMPRARIAVLSNVHEIYGCRRTWAERKDLVFVGSFQHPPNVDAVRWFVSEVFPLVRAHASDIGFHIIGNRAPQAVTDLASTEGVVVHGYVEDIAPFMDGCRISVAPLRVGAGVKGKVNMAMSYGLPVVATATAVEGMHVQTGLDVLVADTPQEFADAILRLYQDEMLWQNLSANGLVNVGAHFSFDAARKALADILPN